MPEPLTPEQLRLKAYREEEHRVIRLQDELDRLIKLQVFARECLEAEFMSGMGYKKLALGDKEVKKLKELTQSMNACVETKIKYDKAAKELAKNMTPAEERKAVAVYIETLSEEERTQLYKELKARNLFPKALAHLPAEPNGNPGS